MKKTSRVQDSHPVGFFHPSRPTGRHSELLLIETLMAILFFSVISALCLQVFARAHILGKQTETLNRGIQETASAASLLEYAGNTDAILWPIMEGQVMDTASEQTSHHEPSSGQTSWANTEETMQSLLNVLKPCYPDCTLSENVIVIDQSPYRMTVSVTAENEKRLRCTLDFFDGEAAADPAYQLEIVLYHRSSVQPDGKEADPL